MHSHSQFYTYTPSHEGAQLHRQALPPLPLLV